MIKDTTPIRYQYLALTGFSKRELHIAFTNNNYTSVRIHRFSALTVKVDSISQSYPVTNVTELNCKQLRGTNGQRTV